MKRDEMRKYRNQYDLLTLTFMINSELRVTVL